MDALPFYPSVNGGKYERIIRQWTIDATFDLYALITWNYSIIAVLVMGFMLPESFSLKSSPCGYFWEPLFSLIICCSVLCHSNSFQWWREKFCYGNFLPWKPDCESCVICSLYRFIFFSFFIQCCIWVGLWIFLHHMLKKSLPNTITAGVSYIFMLFFFFFPLVKFC